MLRSFYEDSSVVAFETWLSMSGRVDELTTIITIGVIQRACRTLNIGAQKGALLICEIKSSGVADLFAKGNEAKLRKWLREQKQKDNFQERRLELQFKSSEAIAAEKHGFALSGTDVAVRKILK